MLPSQGRTEIYYPALPALVRIGTAFPPLVDDIIGFLVQLGRVCLSQSCLHSSYDHRIVSSMLRQLDKDLLLENESEEEEKKESTTCAQTLTIPKVEPMEVEVKREGEEGELEEGELPDAKAAQHKKDLAVRPTPMACEKLKDLASDLSVPFSQAQIRELFKLLPETSMMGAEVSRTFTNLCNKAILLKQIY